MRRRFVGAPSRAERPVVGVAPLLLLLLLTVPRAAVAARELQIAAPLQALTIWDPELKEEAAESGGATFRSRFLPRFRAGLEAEADARRKLAEQEKASQQQQVAAGSDGKNWAEQAAASEVQQAARNEKLVEEAYDRAIAQFDAKTRQKMRQKIKKRNANKYQFVGVVNSHSPEKPPIAWYARRKPAGARWSVRLVHVNREAVLKDLYDRGRIDVFGRYENTGTRDEKTGQPVVAGKYTVRERSWR